MRSFKQFIFSSLMITGMTDVSMAQKQAINDMDWKIAATLPVPPHSGKQLGLAGAIAGVHNNVLIVAGGANFPDAMPWLGGKKKYHDHVYLFGKDGSGNLVNFLKIDRLPFATAYGASCSTPQGIVYAGGENEKGISNEVLLIQWDVSAKKIIVKDLPKLPLALTNASITSEKNLVYVAGGETADSVSSMLMVLDMDNLSKGWKKLPSLPKPVSHAVLAVQEVGKHKCLYVLGGRKRNPGSTSELYRSVYQFELSTKSWTEKKPLPYALSAGTGVATGSHYILMFGGDKGETFSKTESLIAAINMEKDEAKKEKLNQEKMILQSGHPGFDKKVLRYNTITDEWTVIGSIPFEVPVTTTAFKWGDHVIIPSGEVKAGVRTSQILTGKLPFN